MVEKDIENLLSLYPDEFFPKDGFKLKGQQINIAGRRADIIFTDKYDRTIVLEIKQGVLTRDAAGQITEYYGLLKQENPNQNIELILCANIIPHERRIFLENAGIECKELPLSLVKEIAAKNNYRFSDEYKEGTAKRKISKAKQTKTLLTSRVLRYIEKFGRPSYAEMMRGLSYVLSSKELAEIIDTLKLSGQIIEEVDTKISGRTRRVFGINRVTTITPLKSISRVLRYIEKYGTPSYAELMRGLSYMMSAKELAECIDSLKLSGQVVEEMNTKIGGRTRRIFRVNREMRLMAQNTPEKSAW